LCPANVTTETPALDGLFLLEKEEADRHSLNCKVDEVVAMLSGKRDDWYRIVQFNVPLDTV